MSNILIIKHGSLGDISQISGVLKDLRETYSDKKIYLLTTFAYVELLSSCPYVDRVLLDKRLARWNILYLIKLKRLLSKFNFTHVYDLQNSSRTSFYRKFLLRNAVWSSTETILKKNEKKKDFDKDSVLERFKTQLEATNVKTNHTLKPDFSWAHTNVDRILNKYFDKKFILLFPFCSQKLAHKKWPHFNNLIKIIKYKHPKIEIVTVPGPNEIEEAKKINTTVITDKQKPLNIMQLTGIIMKANFIIANDTGPAHISAHLGKSGIAIFGHHTSPKKVSIETENFKAISNKNLNHITAEEVYSEVREKLELIDKV